MKRVRPLHARKLLSAKTGGKALTFLAVAAFPGCNLLPPPPCEEEGTCSDPVDAGSDHDADAMDAVADDAGTEDAGDAADD